MIHHEAPRHRRTAAAKYIENKTGAPCSPATLARLASVGGGPKFQKIGHVPVYSDEDLDAWIASRTSEKVASTAELSRKPNNQAHPAEAA